MLYKNSKKQKWRANNVVPVVDGGNEAAGASVTAVTTYGSDTADMVQFFGS